MSQSLNTVVSQLDAMARFHATRAGIARDPRSAARHLAQVVSIYGRNWKVRAPMGETSLVTITKYRSHKTERGTMLRWGKDHRFPAARYWQGGVYPEGVETLQDYARDSGVPDAGNRSDDWLVEHGYVIRDGNWMPDIMAVAHDIRLEMAAARAAEEMMDDDVKLAAD